MEDLLLFRAHLFEMHRLARGIPSVQYFIGMAVAEADECIERQKNLDASFGPIAAIECAPKSEAGRV